MLLRCLELKDSIKRFIRHLRHEQPNELDYSPITDALSNDNWDDVTKLVDFLQAPYELTKRLEGSTSVSGFRSLWQTLFNLQALWAHYYEASEHPHTQRNQYFKPAVSYGKVKLDSYFDLVHL
jgi:hypothetical protein